MIIKDKQKCDMRHDKTILKPQTSHINIGINIVIRIQYILGFMLNSKFTIKLIKQVMVKKQQTFISKTLFVMVIE